MTELEQLFPVRTIPLYGDKKMTIRPIPLSKLGEIINVITPLLDPDNTLLAARDAAAMVATYSMDILPLCVDVPMEAIPLAIFPDIIDAILDFNFPIETLKKWLALGTRVKEIKVALGGKPKASGK